MQSHQNLLNNKLYQVDQELITYGTYEIAKLMEIIDTVVKMEIIDTIVNLNNRTTAVEKELLNRTLYYDMGQDQNYKSSVNYV